MGIIYDTTGTRREKFNLEAEIMLLWTSKLSKMCHGRGHFEIYNFAIFKNFEDSYRNIYNADSQIVCMYVHRNV